jgi:hypothetical protein
MAILVGVVLLITIIASLFGNPQLAGVTLLPVSMLIAAMFFTSTYFSFRDCFETGPTALQEALP